MKRLWIGLCAALMLVCSCEDPGALEQFGASTGELDSSKINERLDDLEDRVSKLETLCNTMNSNITALQTAVKALEDRDYITSVTPITENGVEVGYTITFAKNGTITLYHGKDGITPVIGVKQDTDGIWYWTLNGEWLLDEAGNKVKATGTDGQDGTPGQNGDDGKNGADGKDGVTPLLKIENDYWYVSYDNGATWTELGKAAGENGGDGADATSSFFKSITWDSSYVYITMADGTELTIPLVAAKAALSVDFVGADKLDFNAGSPVAVNFAVTGANGIVTVETLCDNGWEASAEMTSDASGVVTITPPAVLKNGKMILFVTDEAGRVAMKSLVINPDFIALVSDVLAVSHKGGIVSAALTTNLDYTVNIPEDAQEWVSHVATKAVRTEALEFSVLENPADSSRSAEIHLCCEAAGVIEILTIFQYGVIDDAPLADDIILFADSDVKAICVANFDADSDGEISISEAKAVTDIGTLFRSTGIISFDEFRHFTGIQEIAAYAFRDCESLASIELPESVTYLSSEAFKNCSALTSVDFPKNLNKIGSHCFAYSGLSGNLVLPSSLTKIENSAFACCDIISANIPESVVAIENSAFSGCEYLKEITLPESLTILGTSVFSGCSSLENLVIPSGITVLDYWLCEDCVSLKSVSLSDDVTEIRQRAFSGCAALEDFEFPASLNEVEQNAFYGCANLKVEVPNIQEIGVDAFKASGITKITVPEGTLRIAYREYQDCVNLEEIVIPESVTEVGREAFQNCKSLKSISLSTEVTEIGEHAFDGCESLTSFTCPELLRVIEQYTFYGCTSLKEIIFHDAITEIEASAFANCTSLTSVVLPAKLETLPSHLFEGCTSLTSVTLPVNLTSIPSALFHGCTNLVSITVPAAVTEIDCTAFQYCRRVTELVVLAETPPALISSGTMAEFYPDFIIKVPAASVEAYKAATGWLLYAEQIVAIE